MAYDINRATRAQGWPEFRFPAAHFEWADQSFGNSGGTSTAYTYSAVSVATSGSGDCLSGMRFFRALVHIKTHVIGTSTTETQWSLEVADNATFVTNWRVIGSGVTDHNLASSATPQAITIYGIAPLATAQFVRVRARTNGTETGSFDVAIDAC